MKMETLTPIIFDLSMSDKVELYNSVQGNVESTMQGNVESTMLYLLNSATTKFFDACQSYYWTSVKETK